MALLCHSAPVSTFTSYLPNLGASSDQANNAQGGRWLPKPLQSRPESVSGLPREALPGLNSCSNSLFYSLRDSPEPKSPEHKSPASDSTIQLSSGSETASTPTSSQFTDLRSPAKAHQHPEEEAPKKTRGLPKKTTAGGSVGQRGGHSSPTDGFRDRSSSGSRLPERQTRWSARPRGPQTGCKSTSGTLNSSFSDMTPIRNDYFWHHYFY